MSQILSRVRITEKKIPGEYVDSDDISWEYEARVQINSSYEIISTRIECLGGFDSEGEQIKMSEFLSERVLEGIKEQAGRLALERVETVDFEQEDEREE